MSSIIKNTSILVLILLNMTVALYAEEKAGDAEAASPSAATEVKPVADNTSVPDSPPSDNVPPQETSSLDSKKDESVSFTDWINDQPYILNIEQKKDKALLREEWRQMLGLDLFYPYFKAREMADKVERKSSFSILRLRGRARIKDDEAKYIFGVKF